MVNWNVVRLFWKPDGLDAIVRIIFKFELNGAFKKGLITPKEFRGDNGIVGFLEFWGIVGKEKGKLIGFRSISELHYPQNKGKYSSAT